MGFGGLKRTDLQNDEHILRFQAFHVGKYTFAIRESRIANMNWRIDSELEDPRFGLENPV
jgi:hypothetical protein